MGTDYLTYNVVACLIVGSLLALFGFWMLLLKDRYEKQNRKSLRTMIVDFMHKQRAILALIVILLASAGGLTLLETRNLSRFNAVKKVAIALVVQAESDLRLERFDEAERAYMDASQRFVDLKHLFSPVLKLNETATREAAELSMRAEAVRPYYPPRPDNRAKADLDSGNQALAAGAMFEARDEFERVLQNKYAPENLVAAAQSGLNKAQALIGEFRDGNARMSKPDPVAEFGSVEQETSFKRSFYQKFNHFLNADEVQLPLLVLPNTDKIDVFLDGAQVGTINADAPKEQNTFRYPWGVHHLRFTKEGFVSVEITTPDLKSPRYKLVLEREK